MSKTIVEVLLAAALWLAASVIYFMIYEDSSGLYAMEKAARGASGRKEPGGDFEHFLVHQGRRRRYLVHVPRGAGEGRALPVVLAFHGGGGRAEAQRTVSRLDRVADRHGFLVVYPDGTGLARGRFLTWNAGICCGYAKRNDVDDVGFVGALLDELAAAYPVDTRRVYATGISNGAMLCYRLAREMPGRIAAIGPVSGGMDVAGPTPGHAVPLVHIHGHKDPHAFFLGGRGPILGVPHPAIPGVIAWWAKANRCRPEPAEVRRERDYTLTRYEPAPGADGAPVLLYELPEGGHTWPGGVDLTARLGTGRLVESFDASSVLWDFFRKHALPGTVEADGLAGSSSTSHHLNSNR